MSSVQLQQSIELLKTVKTYVEEFQRGLKAFRQENYTGSEWMIGSQDEIAKAMAPKVLAAVNGSRQNIARNIPDVTIILNAYGLPWIWKVFPPPMFGGLVRKFNFLEAFIDVTLEDDARPNVIHVLDILDKGIWACERDLESNPVAETLRSVPKRVGAGIAWFFPKEIQRVILGWVMICFFLGLLLRYIFGFRLEEIGKLVTKWVFK